MVTQDELKSAIETGHKASSVLRDVCSQLAQMSCPEAYGFEGAETFQDCEKCVVCLSKRLLGGEP